MEERCAKVLNKLHLMTEPFRPFVRTEYSVMKQVLGRTCLNKVGGQATAFSIGKNYHSRCHIDSDMYYTMLTVCGPSSVDDDKVIYYFTFPEYQIKIPLRSGNLLFFNPSILHSCSNPSVEPSFIMSGYVSTRTVLRCEDLSKKHIVIHYLNITWPCIDDTANCCTRHELQISMCRVLKLLFNLLTGM